MILSALKNNINLVFNYVICTLLIKKGHFFMKIIKNYLMPYLIEMFQNKMILDVKHESIKNAFFI